MGPIPVAILGGSDRVASALPASGAGLHPLATYKGAALRVDGRALVEVLVERVRASGAWGPVTVVGPARVYGPLGLDAAILDTDGSVATNLRAAIDAHTARSDGPLAVLACDVLPTADELARLAALHAAAAPCALWFPLVRRPADARELGAFAWKPTYPVARGDEDEPERVLPGHLGVFDPRALRLPLLYRLFDAAYRTRNRSLRLRRAVMLRTVLLSLLARDVLLLLRLRAPTRTASVVSNGLRMARQIEGGRVPLPGVEQLIGRIFLRADAPHEDAVRFPVVDVVSLAEDVDTEEEARQLRAEPGAVPEG